MSGTDAATLLRFALLSAIGGPILGVLVFWWLPLALVAAAQLQFDDVYFGTLWMLTTGALLLTDNAPPAALLGAVGTWLLLRRPARGRRGLRILGTAYGAIAGAALALFEIARGRPFSAYGGGLALLSGALDPAPEWQAAVDLGGNVAAGAGTGMMLGWFVAGRIAGRG
jgi:hypothetical protein